MKRSLPCFLVCFLFILSAAAVNAQSINSRTGRIPFEKQGQISKNYVTVQPQNTEWTAYGYEINSMYSFSVPVPEGTPFSWLAYWWNPSPYFASSMTEGPDNQFFITNISQGPNQPPALYRFNPNTGSITYDGLITGMGDDQPNGIAYNHNNGKYYIVSGTMLYQFDICSLTAQPVGPLNSAGGMIDLCFREGVCYAYDIFDDNAYTIDIATGNAELLGAIGFDAEYGQGMSCSEYPGTIFLSAFNNQTLTAQLRTMDPVTGMTTLVTDWGYCQIAPFEVQNDIVGYPVSPATNPDPPSGAGDIGIGGVTLSWINHGWGTNESEVWFNYSGTPFKLYDGSLISSFPTGALPYQTICEWRINSKYADNCSLGSLWSFTTETVPASGFYDSFYNLDNWTAIGPYGIENWHIVWVQFTGGASPPELVCNQDPFFNGLSRLISCPISTVPGEHVQIHFRQFLECADSATLSGIAVTYDDGQTSTILRTNTDVPCSPHKDLFYTAFIPEAIPFRLILFINGISSNISWLLDDLYAYNCPDCPPPNAPGSLSAQIIYDPGSLVYLNWDDVSWNELGFDIFRKAGNPNDPGEYVQVGNADQNTTRFTDNSVSPESTYTYRVFSSNYNGSGGSGTATITLPIPVELISFTGLSDASGVTLYWQTATETNNRGFEIQRMESGSNTAGDEIPSDCGGQDIPAWKKIGYAAGSGTTTKPVSYSFRDNNVTVRSYSYRLKQMDYDGSFKYSKEITVDIEPPGEFSLSQNFPDPFNPSTTIEYSLPYEEIVSFKVYDILGNEVMNLVNGKQKAGDYLIGLNLSDLASGIYIYRLTAGKYSLCRKMVLMK